MTYTNTNIRYNILLYNFNNNFQEGVPFMIFAKHNNTEINKFIILSFVCYLVSNQILFYWKVFFGRLYFRSNKHIENYNIL